MAILTFMMGNLKRRKLYSAVICILVFLTGLILTVTITTSKNAGKAYDTAFNDMEGPHLMYWMEEDKYHVDYKTWYEKQPGVQSVRLKIQRDLKGAVLEHNGTVLRNNIVYRMLIYESSDNMKIVNGIYPVEKSLSRGEIYLPCVFMTGNGLSVGDKVEYKFGKQMMSFVIAGFVEDPIYGGELVGGKFLYISPEDMTELEHLGNSTVSRNMQMRVRLHHYSASDAYRLNKSFVKEFSFNAFTLSTYDAIKSWHLSLPNISLAVMVVFALILSAITITIMRYAILSTIEADFTNIGIVKALGFTPFMVQAAISSQYAFLAMISGLSSLVFSCFISPLIGGAILKSTGLINYSKFSFPAGICIIAALVLVVSLFAYRIAGRTRSIRPVRAIAQGYAPAISSSKLNVNLSKLGFLPFDLRMAAKQVLTKLKRYVLLLFVSALLAYTLVFMLGLVQMFNSERAINMLGGELSDIRVSTETKTQLEQLFAEIRKDYEVLWTTYQKTEQLIIDEEMTIVRIKDDFNATGELSTLRGRHPKQANEAAISTLIRNSLGKDIGDSITIIDESGSGHQFVITGIFQTIDEGGSYVRMLESGMKLLDPEYEMNMGYVKLKSNENLDRVISEMKSTYSGYSDLSNERKQTDDKLNTMQSVFSTISTLVFVLTIAIIGFIVLLIMKITIYSETKELGIFKALGFSSARIRLQLALRFALVTTAGSMMGAVVESLIGSSVFALALRGLGISSLKLEFSLMNVVIPVGMISLLAILSAFVSSGNIKKVSVYSLIND